MAHVLLVEDQPELLDLWQLLLERLGHRVTAVRSGEEAVRALFRAWPAYDLLVLDLVLPGVMGREVLALARRQLRRRTPVIAISGRGWAREAIERDPAADVAFVLAKPVTVAEFERAVGEALALGRSWRGEVAAEDDRLELTSRLEELVDQVVDLHREALADPLTGLPNRRALEIDARDAFDGLGARGGRLALVLVDADDFSRFNRLGGYRGGDRVIRSLAEALRGAIRDGDRLYRFGGDEFVVLVEVDGAEDATVVAERLRRKAARIETAGERTERLSISIGVALASPAAGAVFHAVFDAANAALRTAKERGGDRVVLFSGSGLRTVTAPAGPA